MDLNDLMILTGLTGEHCRIPRNCIDKIWVISSIQFPFRPYKSMQKNVFQIQKKRKKFINF